MLKKSLQTIKRSLTNSFFTGITKDIQFKRICIVGGGQAGLAVIEELKNRGFQNLTIIDKENFTSSSEQKFLASCGIQTKSEENNLKKIAEKNFNFVFGRVREINYEYDNSRQHEIVLTDGQKMLYDCVVMCNGMENDNKKVENLDKLKKRRDKPVFTAGSMEDALFAGRHLKGVSGKVLFTSEGNKSKDFYVNYSVNFLPLFS